MEGLLQCMPSLPTPRRLQLRTHHQPGFSLKIWNTCWRQRQETALAPNRNPTNIREAQSVLGALGFVPRLPGGLASSQRPPEYRYHNCLPAEGQQWLPASNSRGRGLVQRSQGWAPPSSPTWVGGSKPASSLLCPEAKTLLIEVSRWNEVHVFGYYILFFTASSGLSQCLNQWLLLSLTHCPKAWQKMGIIIIIFKTTVSNLNSQKHPCKSIPEITFGCLQRDEEFLMAKSSSNF